MATSDPPADAPSVREDVHELIARLSTREDGTTICTLYPADVAADEQTASWIRAMDGSFVDVEDHC